MIYAYINARKLTPQVKKWIDRVVRTCKVCKKNAKSNPKPSVAISRATNFNSIVTSDLKQMCKKYILWMVDVFSRMLAGVVLKDRKAETILEKLEMEWCLSYEYPSIGLYADNGSKLKNYKMEEFVSKLGKRIEFS